MTVIRIGTRTSALALWQANKVSSHLESNGFTTEIVGITSTGDKSLGGDLASSVGQFIHAVDEELLSQNIDIAVHSAKDVPVNISQDLRTLAYLERGCTNDLLIFPPREDCQNLAQLLDNCMESSVDDALELIPKSGMVGTVSGRRQSFLLSKRPDIIPIAVRGQIETRLMRLKQGRASAIILAEIGLQRLHEIHALEPWILEMSAVRISDQQWPTAPGQGAISVHCRSTDFDKFGELRNILNHPSTEQDVSKERDLLKEIGGGCLYPAGIKIENDNISIQISPKNWREIFCQGLSFKSEIFTGKISDYQLALPDGDVAKTDQKITGPKLISTLNSNRLASILQNKGINVVNKPVIELVAKKENWPSKFIDESNSRSNWPYLVLTSPFAARCAIEVATTNPDLKRIQWLAIGEGTARACFMRGVTVSVCAGARNSEELLAYIDKKLERNIELMIPRSNVASKDLVLGLEKLGFKTNSWIGYDNISKEMSSFDVQTNDVLLLSSPSSARAWVENSLPIPKNILCMGKSSLEEIDSLGYFSNSTVEILQGPTAEFVAKWWNRERGD